MSEELVKRLRNLDVSQYSEGHPFGLLAEAAATIERLARERDHWKDYSSGQGRLIESGVFVSNDDYSKLIAAESELAKAREALTAERERCAKIAARYDGYDADHIVAAILRGEQP
jgi:hypothetical protein